MNFHKKTRDLEVRSCNDKLTQHGEHTTAEIIKWTDRGTCYTLAYWIKGSEGYELKFVANRPFEVDSDVFMWLAKIGQTVLNELY